MINVEPQFYEFFDSVPIPDSLKDKIIGDSGQVIDSIKGTKKINIIVGENDAGKSYLLRELFKNPQIPNYDSERLRQKIEDVIAESYNELLQIIAAILEQRSDNEWKIFPSTYNTVDRSGGYVVSKRMFHKEQNEPYKTQLLILYRTLVVNNDLIQNNSDISCRLVLNSINDSIGDSDEASDSMFDIDKGRIKRWMEKTILNIYPFIFNNKNNSVEVIEKHLPLIQNTYNLYFINHFRTLRREQLKDLNNIVAEVAFSEESLWSQPNISSKSISLKGNNGINDFVQNGYVETGTTLYSDLERKYFNIPGRKVLEEFEKFLSELIFDGQEVVIVPARDIKDETGKSIIEFQIQIGEQKPRPIHELGTGIQMIIILTWFLFESDYGIVFIQEPELFIHPGLQRQLMKMYARHPRSNNFKFYIATHSNHITDFIQYEPELCSMYMIKKVLGDNPTNPKFMLKHYTEDEVLQTLGVTQSSLFLANCAIWVEGITDWKYIRTWFSLYLKTKTSDVQYKEGLHYAFVEYGGALLKHWEFYENRISRDTISALRVTRNVFVIADRGANVNRTQELTQRINNDNLFIMQGDEIENLIKDEVLKAAVRTREGKRSLGKNVVINNQEEYQSLKLEKKIGYLIDSYFQYDDGNPLTKDYSDESGTVKSKKDFCEVVVRETESLFNEQNFSGQLEESDLNLIMTDEVIDLCRRMFEFIQRHNN